MKTKKLPKVVPSEPTQDDIREYAYHLYLQSGCIPGRDLDNWLEAKACLRACIPKSKTHTRLHHHTHRPAGGVITVTSPEVRNLVV